MWACDDHGSKSRTSHGIGCGTEHSPHIGRANQHKPLGRDPEPAQPWRIGAHTAHAPGFHNPKHSTGPGDAGSDKQRQGEGRNVIIRRNSIKFVQGSTAKQEI